MSAKTGGLGSLSVRGRFLAVVNAPPAIRADLGFEAIPHPRCCAQCGRSRVEPGSAASGKGWDWPPSSLDHDGSFPPMTGDGQTKLPSQ
jgi:hypothetical protein